VQLKERVESYLGSQLHDHSRLKLPQRLFVQYAIQDTYRLTLVKPIKKSRCCGMLRAHTSKLLLDALCFASLPTHLQWLNANLAA
jgi:hypothetical protein